MKGKQPTWDNPRIYALINAKVNDMEARSEGYGLFKPIKEILPLDEVYLRAKRKPIIQIISQEDHEPTKFATTNDTLKVKEYPYKKKQHGQRYNWWVKGLNAYWDF